MGGLLQYLDDLAELGRDRARKEEVRIALEGSSDEEVWAEIGSETQKTRPCVVVSPDEMTAHIRTVIVAPLTTHGSACPSRVACHVGGSDGLVVLDRIRTVDQARLVRRVGSLEAGAASAVLAVLREMLAS